VDDMAVNLTRSQLRQLHLMTEGGEAFLYEYKNDLLLKIFKPQVNIAIKQKKVERLLKAKLPSNVISPIETVLVDGKFAGYVMRKLVDAEIIHQYTKNKKKKIEKLSNKDMVDFALQISETLDILHGIGVTIGDISDYNILVKNKRVYFIDTDSWGIDNILIPDAYTELYAPPESYTNKGIVLNAKSDLYSFAIVAFNIMHNIHPFNGTLISVKNEKIDMPTTERMKKKISVLGNRKNQKVIIPKMIQSWKWMSPQLTNAFLEIFEKDKRESITGVLQDEMHNMKFCNKHSLYYYNKYTDCPLCNEQAKVINVPVIQKVAGKAGGIVQLVFEGKEVYIILNNNCYLNNANEVVHIETGNKVKMENDKRIEFFEDGNFIIKANKNVIEVLSEDGRILTQLPKLYDSDYRIKGNDLYYVDISGALNKLTIGERGNINRTIAHTFHPIFEVSDTGEIFIASMYPKKAVISANGCNFEIPYEGKILEYAIKHDYVSKSWLFVYKLKNGKFRTLILQGSGVIYDSEEIKYHAYPLSNMEYVNNTIYDSADGKIVGTNLLKNVSKEFICTVVQEDSKLKFVNGKVIITNQEKIYSYGS